MYKYMHRRLYVCTYVLYVYIHRGEIRVRLRVAQLSQGIKMSGLRYETVSIFPESNNFHVSVITFSLPGFFFFLHVTAAIRERANKVLARTRVYIWNPFYPCTAVPVRFTNAYVHLLKFVKTNMESD